MSFYLYLVLTCKNIWNYKSSWNYRNYFSYLFLIFSLQSILIFFSLRSLKLLLSSPSCWGVLSFELDSYTADDSVSVSLEYPVAGIFPSNTSYIYILCNAINSVYYTLHSIPYLTKLLQFLLFLNFRSFGCWSRLGGKRES